MPTIPGRPILPRGPCGPGGPWGPTSPRRPFGASCPRGPLSPAGPIGPGFPLLPLRGTNILAFSPGIPFGPTAPVGPFIPGFPGGPGGPGCPSTPGAPGRPGEPARPCAPATIDIPSTPGGPGGPAPQVGHLMHPTKFVRSVVESSPSLPGWPGRPAVPSDPGMPGGPGGPGRPAGHFFAFEQLHLHGEPGRPALPERTQFSHSSSQRTNAGVWFGRSRVCGWEEASVAGLSLFEMNNSGTVSVLHHIGKKNGQVRRKLKADQSTIDQIKSNGKQRAGHLTLNWDEILLTQRLQFQMYKYHLHHRLHDHYDHIPQAQLAKTDHPKYTDDCIEHSREDGKIQLTFPYVVIVDEVQHAGNGQRPQKRWRMSNY
ncbi:IgA FC receptor [Trichinella spiralis]|uniref:IgA FC receptor n=1 Tax=Trichinella spiralis TaxID=6334 RepID=A0A0V1B4J7_TRISP|nr:IgA FC receptor [Trichinella spiralis]